MYRPYFRLLVLTAVTLFYLSCSSSREASGPSSQSDSFPGWYSGSAAVTTTASGFTAYGTALAADSAVSSEKAIAQALSNLEQHLSDRLESIRSEAAEAAGEGSGLNAPAFIFKLRNAEAGIADLSATSNREAQPSRQYEGYRGFAGVTLSRKDLIDYLDTSLGSHQDAWDAMKASPAFDERL